MNVCGSHKAPSRSARAWLASFLWLSLFLSACASAAAPRSHLELDVQPATLQADGAGAVSIQYRLARQSLVSVTLRSANGESHVLRDRVARGPGTYSFSFRGAIAGRVLPNGLYEVVATAQGSAADETIERRQPLTIVDADTEPPVIANLHVTPAVVSPNQDGVDDRLAIRFAVAEPVSVLVRLLVGDESLWLIEDGAAAPGLVQVSWPPPLRHAPHLNQAIERLPAGPADLEVAVTDPAGNRSVVHQRIVLGETGTPQAQLSEVEITPAVVKTGGTISVSATITNSGAVTLRAAPLGPTVYAWGEDAPTRGYLADTGTVRWGVEFSLNRSGIAYPFRWGLGRDLAPGESVAVTGEIQITDEFPLEPVQLWVGIIHENNRVLADKRGITRIERNSGADSDTR